MYIYLHLNIILNLIAVDGGCGQTWYLFIYHPTTTPCVTPVSLRIKLASGYFPLNICLMVNISTNKSLIFVKAIKIKTI